MSSPPSHIEASSRRHEPAPRRRKPTPLSFPPRPQVHKGTMTSLTPVDSKPMSETDSHQSTDGISELRQAIDAAFASDWSFDPDKALILRRPNASRHRHLVWGLYRWLKHQCLNEASDMMKFGMPMRGDNMPPTPGAPRKWEWTHKKLRIREDDLEFLTGGPLVTSEGTMLVRTVEARRDRDGIPRDREDEVRMCERDWEFVPQGRIIRRRLEASNVTHRVEALYWASKRFAATEVGIAYKEPLDRDGPQFGEIHRRYWTSGEWRMESTDATYLSDGPLFHHETLLVKGADGNSARRIYLEDIDSFALAAQVDPDLADQMLNKGLLGVSEEQVKLTIHSILGDSHVRKDHGGERSDIFTTICVGGKRVQGAFALKGPSIGRKVTVAKFGKNGDQVIRLFEEPAELYVVQANGVFESLFVKHVVQTAEAQGRHLNYCLIDGRDTSRLLLAHGFDLDSI